MSDGGFLEGYSRTDYRVGVTKDLIPVIYWIENEVPPAEYPSQALAPQATEERRVSHYAALARRSSFFVIEGGKHA